MLAATFWAFSIFFLRDFSRFLAALEPVERGVGAGVAPEAIVIFSSFARTASMIGSLGAGVIGSGALVIFLFLRILRAGYIDVSGLSPVDDSL